MPLICTAGSVLRKATRYRSNWSMAASVRREDAAALESSLALDEGQFEVREDLPGVPLDDLLDRLFQHT